MPTKRTSAPHKPKTKTPSTSEGAIRERAYRIWEEENRPHGRDFDHWQQAEREISGAVQKKTVRKPRKTVPKG